MTPDPLADLAARLAEDPDAVVARGDTVLVQGTFHMRVVRVGERGALVCADNVWKSIERGGLPPNIRDLWAVPLKDLVLTGPARRFRRHIGWHVGG